MLGIDGHVMDVLAPYPDRSIDISKYSPTVENAIEGGGVFVGLGRLYDRGRNPVETERRLNKMGEEGRLVNSYGRSFGGGENVIFLELSRR